MSKWSVDVLALFIAATALLFSFWQGFEQRRHNHISVEPRMTSYFSSNSKEKQWGIYIINNGMGTAFVKNLKVLVDGEVVPKHEYGKFASAAEKLGLDYRCFLFGGPRPNDSFQVGEENFLVEAHKSGPLIPKTCPKDKISLLEFQKNRLDFELTVESIYGDEFIYVYSENSQVKI